MNQIFKLFIPMLSSNLILILSGLVDIAYVGHFSNDHVAALSVTLSLYTVVYVIGMGILQGVMLKLSEAYGCHDIPRIRQIFIQGVWLMLGSALVSIACFTCSVIYQNYLVHLNMSFQLLKTVFGLWYLFYLPIY